MPIRTTANTYTRGILRSENGYYNNFFLVAQTNNTIISPMSSYIRGYQFNNRNYINFGPGRRLWKP